MRIVGALALLAIVSLSAVTAPACATVAPWIPVAIQVLSQAPAVLDTIQAFEQAHFTATPDAAKQKAVEQALAKTRAALALSLDAIRGTQALTQEQVNAAFADFSAAYTQLLALVGPLGISAGGARLGVSPGALQVPAPEALVPRVAT